MKKASIILVLAILVSVLPINTVLAYNYPPAFWAANDEYIEALESKDYPNIIRYGTDQINAVKYTEDCYEKRDIMTSRYREVAAAYAEIGDYESSRQTYQELYDYSMGLGDDYYHNVKIAKSRIDQYTPQIAMYTDNGTAPFYGAKNEKRNGVLFGMCANGATRSKIPNESMILTYQELGQKLLSYNVGIMKTASSKGLAVEFALNCPKEGKDIKNIKKMNSYLKEISDLLREYPNTPVYLRFAAEFDVWTNLAEPDEFIEAFRYVSKYFKDRNQNVAIVWSPNQVSGWTVNIDDYYPGDEYVDWVGVSSYAKPYFLGDKNQSVEDEVLYKYGLNSNPVIALKDIVQKYGNRKPIMISESGCCHRLVTTGENTSDFAMQRIKEYMYYLPMVYPQIKVMAYFDWYVDGSGEAEDFRLSTNSKLQNEYIKATKTSRFIQNKYSNNTDFCYREIVYASGVNSVFPVSCYAHKYNSKVVNVTYFIDDNYVGQSSEMPYTAYIDAGDYSGRHRLKAVAVFDDGEFLMTEQEISITNVSSDITVEISGEKVNFDQEPISYNNRTMVPMRKIFEELGAKVTWDGSTQTATGKKGDRTVKVTVGSKVMYVNNTRYELDTAPITMSGRTLVPARAVAEGMGCDVEWDGRYSLVSITPKVFRWSNWERELPSYVTSDLYYIEESDEYRYRTREKEYFTLDHKIGGSNYVESETTYGSWSDWQNEYISETDERDVETRERSSPKSYHYAHYCTGYEKDKSKRYKTADHNWCDECTYHDLGWYSNLLDPADDGVGYLLYKDNGDIYRCDNTCYRWYIIETEGGSYTQYRSRSITTTYTYWEWGDWSRWSSWDDEDPYYDYDGPRNSIEIDERTVYRYKEKG